LLYNNRKQYPLDNKLGRNHFIERGKDQNATFYTEPTVKLVQRKVNKLYLDFFKGLLDVTCLTAANMLKGKTPVTL
jgi:hypothetical protein